MITFWRGGAATGLAMAAKRVGSQPANNSGSVGSTLRAAGVIVVSNLTGIVWGGKQTLSLQT